MKRIPLFLVLTLIAAWGYTSWYWYTCNIKGACQQELSTIDVTNDNNTQTTFTQSGTNNEIAIEREVETQSNSGEEVQSLSRGDVLLGNAVIPQAPVVQEEETSEVDTSENENEFDESNEITSSGAVSESSSDSALERELGLNSTSQTQTSSSLDLCTNPLTGPISSGGANNSTEVAKLEAFLIANAYLGSSDGVYGSADLEAVKQLQLDYKAQMLDPWGIDAPTGYVGTTTVATINSIGCKN